MRLLLALAIAFGAVLTFVLRRGRDTIRMDDIGSWFTRFDERFGGEDALRMTILERTASGVRLTQGYFDRQANTFLHSRVIDGGELDEALAKLHASDKIVVYQ